MSFLRLILSLAICPKHEKELRDIIPKQNEPDLTSPPDQGVDQDNEIINADNQFNNEGTCDASPSAITKKYFRQFAQSVNIERVTTYKKKLEEETVAKKELAAVKLFDTMCSIMFPQDVEQFKKMLYNVLIKR